MHKAQTLGLIPQTNPGVCLKYKTRHSPGQDRQGIKAGVVRLGATIVQARVRSTRVQAFTGPSCCSSSSSCPSCSLDCTLRPYCLPSDPQPSPCACQATPASTPHLASEGRRSYLHSHKQKECASKWNRLGHI